MKPEFNGEHEDILGSVDLSPQAPRAEEYSVQRRWDRVRLSTHIKVHRTLDGVFETTDGQAQDLCIGGIGAYIPNTFAVDEMVTVEFVLPLGHRPIKFEAIVRDAKGFRYGFEFLRVQDNEATQLRESIAAFALKAV
jgi:PilZ domain